MFKIFRCVLAIIALQLIILSAALAAGTQTTALSTVGGASPAYTDLGAAPLQVQAIGGDVKIIIADSGATPSLALAGNVLFQGQYQTFNPASATSHVWAIGLNGAPSASYSPIYASTPLGSVTQGTSPWVVSGTVGPYAYTPLSPGQHNFTITSSTALTIPTGATYATLCASVATIKYTTDGTTTPTSSVGMPLANGSCVGFSGATVLSNLRLISATGTADVEYFK